MRQDKDIAGRMNQFPKAGNAMYRFVVLGNLSNPFLDILPPISDTLFPLDFTPLILRRFHRFQVRWQNTSADTAKVV